jgi:hypothetical protein
MKPSRILRSKWYYIFTTSDGFPAGAYRRHILNIDKAVETILKKQTNIKSCEIAPGPVSESVGRRIAVEMNSGELIKIYITPDTHQNIKEVLSRF